MGYREKNEYYLCGKLIDHDLITTSIPLLRK